jgi:dephospho-CoA kinase
VKIIGLTGGIASGKSTVARTLKDLGVILIDADDVAHSIIEPSKPAWNDIVKVFGKEILNPDLSINRAKLGEIVFNNADKMEELNLIVHPRVMEEHQHELQQIEKEHPDAIVVLDVPLLFETHMEQLCNEVWVVWLDRETQIERLMSRNNYNREQAVARINSQMSLDEKAKRADVVIDNSKSIEETIETTTRYFNNII